jgi:hypothetical protein
MTVALALLAGGFTAGWFVPISSTGWIYGAATRSC